MHTFACEQGPDAQVYSSTQSFSDLLANFAHTLAARLAFRPMSPSGPELEASAVEAGRLGRLGFEVAQRVNYRSSFVSAVS